MAENKKRPPFYKIRERAEWDALHKTYEEIRARVLTPEEVTTFDITFPNSWQQKPVYWIKDKLGLNKPGNPPEGSGAGFVQSPDIEFYTKQYGVNPIQDLYKYRKIIRSQPDVQQAIQLQVSMAFGKGFMIEHPSVRVKKFLNKFSDRINLLQEMLVLGQDMIGYGFGVAEICWNDRAQQREQIYDFNGAHVSTSDVFKWELNKKVKEVNPPKVVICPNHGFNPTPEETAGCEFCKEYKTETDKFEANVIKRQPVKDKKVDILGLKPLDPVYIRVRRDSYGNIFGYTQWMTSPPVLLDNENVVFIKHRPHSTGVENAYGQSILLSFIRTNALLEQFEKDMAIAIHSRAVPPLVVKGGKDPMHPYSTAQMKDLLSKLASRGAASIIGVKSDVDIQELQGVARNLNVGWWLQYLKVRRYQALGIPPVLMGEPEGTNRAVGEVVFQDYITRLQLLQKMMADAIETQVLWPLAKARFGADTEKPVIVWKPIVEEDRNMRAQRLIQALQARAISVNEFRQAIGFEAVSGKPELDEVGATPAVPPSNLLGPPKPVGQEPEKPGQTSPEQKVPPFAKPSPEGVKKKEEEQRKNLKLMLASGELVENLKGIIDKAKFELRQGDRKVKDITTESLRVANKFIDEYGLLSQSLGNDNFDVSEYQADFKEIINGLVKAKSEGLL
jgi:hypothetical protein